MKSGTEKRFFDIIPPKGVQFKAAEGGKDLLRFALIGLVVFLVLTVSNIYVKGRELAYESKKIAFAGFEELQGGIISLASQDFEQAGSLFGKARTSLRRLSESTHYLTAQGNVLLGKSLYLDTAQKLIDSGILVSRMGQEFIEVIDQARGLPQAFMAQEKSSIGHLRSLHDRLGYLLADAIQIQKNLTTLNAGLLPPDIRQHTESGQNQISEVIAILRQADEVFEVGLKLLGDKKPHYFLILFQNKYERRAAGGFMGSYMLITVNDGAIVKMESRDIYDTDGQLTEVVPAPPGIDQVADQWYMRDANYSPDFPASAEKIKWFLEHSRGPSVDTVIAIDQTVAERLLEITGPIVLPHFPFQIKAENFSSMLSYHIETKVAGKNKPKQLLFDLISVMKEKFSTMRDLEKIKSIAENLIKEGHIQAYSADPDVQSLARHLGADGRIISPAPKTDYLAVITTSIGGNKSDRFIRTKVNHHTAIDHGGSIENRLIITKTHTWNKESFAEWQRLRDYYGTGQLSENTLRFILGEGANVDYMRVYVPKGSRLVGIDGASNMTQYEDLGYTVFAFEMEVPAGKSETITLDYKLPFQLAVGTADDYRFIAQKQAGAERVILTKELIVADSLRVANRYPGEKTLAWDQDQLFLMAIQSRLNVF